MTEQQLSRALLLQGANGSEKRVDYENGLTMSCAAPVEHNATNVSDVRVRNLEIEHITPKEKFMEYLVENKVREYNILGVGNVFDWVGLDSGSVRPLPIHR